MKARNFVGLVGLVFVFTGCATGKQKYVWGDYDPALYAYYKSPAKSGELEKALTKAIGASEKRGGRVAPGLLAEYGYLQLQQGQFDIAAAYFQRESQLWPESKVFMERMIKVAQKAPPPSVTEGK